MKRLLPLILLTLGGALVAGPIDFNVIVARPERDNVSLSLFSDSPRQVFIECNQKKIPISLSGNMAKTVKLEPLQPNRAYNYQVTDAAGKPLAAGAFHTQRAPRSEFTFCLQADSHLDEATVPELYEKTLAGIKAENPDFLIDLGDTFMTGKLPTRETAAQQYYNQRDYLGRIGDRVPLFLVLGNHDGEERPGELREWSQLQRQKYFANPQPDEFYSGNPEPEENYYAWSWGDALFVVLDPYHNSTSTRGGREPWNFTLGDAQYQWLTQTLAKTKAKYKFVFIHQLTGSMTGAARGGKEAAKLHEWGDVSGEFAKNRPNWELPIHSLLRKYNVNAVFHGHDHFYAREELNGIAYILVPQPAQRNFRKHFAEEYGYKEGVFLPSSGYLRITVTPESAKVEYIRRAMPNMQKNGVQDGMIADSFYLK